MKKKILYVFLALIIGLLLFTSSVKAADNEVSDREMAIASALSYVPLQKNRTMAQSYDMADVKIVSKVVNFVNSKFNLHDYATIHELDEWIVDDYNGGLKVITQNGLTVFRLKKGNDIMIVIRGSNSPTDAFEDIKYGVKNYTTQEKYLNKYINQTISLYANKNENYNIYVTGHSLGGYLAQIAGATIEDTITSKGYSNLKLKKVVDFNGIGINFLTYFGEKYNYGSKSKIIETLKKLGEDGRLVEYYTYGDLVSSLGVHYGEMRMLTPSIDSITYHREIYKALGNFGSKLISVAENNDTLNVFKTDLKGVQNFYKVNNIAAYLNLTHEADAFVTIDLDKSNNTPSVRIIENKNILSSHKADQPSIIHTKKSITLKALTSYASAKKYEWYESDNKKDWKLIKTVDLYNLNGETPTNTLDVNINSIPSGKSKYYKVVSYYDDNYVSSRYHYNTDKKEYEYIETDESKQENSKSVSAIIEVEHKTSSSTKAKTVISNIVSFFKRK